MLSLSYSNRLEDLIAPLADSISDQQRQDPLRPVSIIVPNRAVEQFVKVRVSERIGVAANLKFPFLRAYLTAIVEGDNSRCRVLSADRLHLVVFNCLSNPASRKLKKLAPAYGYVDAGGRADGEAELRCFDLAERLARLFEEYAISRDAMLELWSAGRLALQETDSAGTEIWQQALWQAVFDRSGRAHDEWTGDPDHDWMLLPEAFARTSDATLGEIGRRRLHIFALSSQGNAYAKIFSRMGKLGEVSIYAFNPCREFWEDVDTSRRTPSGGWVHRGARLAGSLDASDDPFGLSHADNRALELWGRPGREYIRLLNELSDCNFDSHFTDWTTGGNASALALLKQDVLDRAPGRKLDSAPQTAGIRFLACPGIRREIEIVASAIWQAIKASAAKKQPLRFHEIAVQIPAAEFEAYAPHIESVFARIGEIPVKLGGGVRSRVVDATQLLLALPRSRFTRTDLLSLLTHRGLHQRGEEIDPGLWDSWCSELGIFFGADQDDLRTTDIPSNLFNWDQALRRLALGAFMSGEASGDSRPMESPVIGDLLPLEIDESDLPAAQAFASLARSLIADALEIRKARIPLSQWRRVLTDYVARYLVADDPDDQRIRDHCIAAIQSLESGGIESVEVSYSVAHTLVLARINEVASERSSFSEGGVAVGPLGTLHAIPFRMIFVLGLGEAFFPARDPHDPLDLRRTRRHPGDLTPSDRDRYLFLGSILAARDQVIFSYVAREPHSGDSLEPSTVIRELQFILAGYLGQGAVQALTLVHPVSRYSLKYFADLSAEDAAATGQDDSLLASFDSSAREGARMTALRDDLTRHAKAANQLDRRALIDSLSPVATSKMDRFLRIDGQRIEPTAAHDDGVLYLPIGALRHFLECPAQGAARVALGMAEDEVADDETDDEPVTISRLHSSIMLRETFWNMAKPGAASDEYAREFAHAQMLGRAPVGQVAEVLRASDLELLDEWRRNATDAIGSELTKWSEIRIGRASARESSARDPLPYLELEVKMAPVRGQRNLRIVRLYGSLGRFSPKLDAAVQFVVRDKCKCKDFLTPFLGAIVLSAAGHTAAADFSATVIGVPPNKVSQPRWTRSFAPPKQKDARGYLSNLVAALLGSTHDYFFPIEAAEKVWQSSGDPAAGKSLIPEIEKIRDDQYQPCSSAYGPLRRWSDLEIPEIKVLKQLAADRFGPIAAIFDNGRTRRRNR